MLVGNGYMLAPVVNVGMMTEFDDWVDGARETARGHVDLNGPDSLGRSNSCMQPQATRATCR